jgi:signal transduction histidine kinase
MEISENLVYIIFISLFLGVFVVKQNRKSKQNITFAMICFGIALWVLGLFLMDLTRSFYWPDKISLFGGLMMVAGLYLFSQVFPTESGPKLDFKQPWKTNTYVRLIPIGIMLVMLPFNLFIKKIIFCKDSFNPVNGPAFPVLALTAGLYMMAAINNFFRQYRNNIGYKRQRMLYVALSLIFFIVTTLICDVILPAFGITLWKFIGPLASTVFLIGSALALVSYNLLDIRLVFKSVLVNTFSLFLVIVAVVSAHGFVQRQILSDRESFTVLFFFAIFGFIALRSGFSWIFSKFFLKDYHLFQGSFRDLNVFLHEEINSERIILTANKYLKIGLGLDWVYYFDVQRNKLIFAPNLNPVSEGKVTIEQVNDEGFSSYVRSLHALKFFYGAELGAFPNVGKAPIAIMPLRNKGEMCGYFVLGPQNSLKGLSFEETQKLQHVWAHIETAYDRALLYQSLEEKVRAQVQDITFKDRKLKETLENKLDFMQVTSHQLRTPITSLNGALQLVISDQVDEDQKQELIQLAYQKSKELNDMISGILKIARLEHADDPKDISECVNLNFVFAGLLPIVEAAARTKDVVIEYDPIAFAEIKGNKLYLEQAFYNILENAVSYSKRGRVRIYFKEEADSVITCIEDGGEGIPEEIRKRIFNRKTSGVDSKGAGLGLYIVKTIVDAHPDATIWFESSEVGTTFFLKLKRYSAS